MKKFNLVLSFFIFVMFVSLTSAETIAEQPSFGEGIVLKIKQILRLNNNLIKKIAEANSYAGRDSVKLEIEVESNSQTFVVCGEFYNGENCIDKSEPINYDELKFHQKTRQQKYVEFGRRAFTKYFFEDSSNGEYYLSEMYFCDGGKRYSFSGSNPGVVIVDDNEIYKKCDLEKESKVDIISELEDFSIFVHPRVRRVMIEEKEVIELYWKNSESEFFAYFDFGNYYLIKMIKRDKRIVEGGEGAGVNLKRFELVSASQKIMTQHVQDTEGLQMPNIDSFEKCVINEEGLETI